MRLFILFLNFIVLLTNSVSYRILAIFPYNGRSHHIYFSSIVEELAARRHNVTVVNFYSVKNFPNIHQISLQSGVTSVFVNIEEHLENLPSWFRDFSTTYDIARAYKFMANSNCEKLVNNEELQGIVKNNATFDVVIVEQFVTDCGLGIAHNLGAPVVGMSAHILMPWMYSRLGATNHPAYVPNHFFSTGTKPNIVQKFKSTLINLFFNTYYSKVIQKRDNEIVRSVYADTPDLEELGKNMSLILLNQYFPLTGSRLYGANVIEVGGIHIKKRNEIEDKELRTFLDMAEYGVIYISFGSVAKNSPDKISKEVIKIAEKSNMRFVWKVDSISLEVPDNVMVRRWLPQSAVLCHPHVVAFISHSGMLSSAEAMHCGVPVISVPIFGDQFANAASVVENGLGVALDLASLDEKALAEALETVLQERYQRRAKVLSQLWRQRTLAPLDTAVFWIEYVAKYKTAVNLKPPTVDLPLYEYLLLDVIGLICSAVLLIFYIAVKLLRFSKKIFRTRQESQAKLKVH